jgi:drug/metabolite transporter (DMT)-like permease
MRIYLAYLSIVLLWATTPLAIKWSVKDFSFLFSVTLRMAIGLACILMILALSRQRLPWHSKARQTYLAVSVQIYASMLVIYWAAQFIPSGWISVIFGLLPLMTALLSAIWLREKNLTLGKLLAYTLGIGGLWILFGSALQMGREAALGIIGALTSTLLHAASSVWIKRINAEIPALAQVSGGLLLSMPLYLATWAIFDGQWPSEIPPLALTSTVYLGVIATTLGFVLYYYLLLHQSANKVALVTLASPVIALFLGHAVNQEPLTLKIATGTALIISALGIHAFFDWLKQKKRVTTQRK